MTGGLEQDRAGRAPSEGQGVMAAVTSFHGIMLTGSVIIMLLSFVMKTNDSNQVFLPGLSMAMPQSCVTKMYWGFDCPGCGMTRAFIRISEGQFTKARQLNAASFVVYLFVAVQIPWHAMQLLRIGRGVGVVDSWWTIVPALGVIVTLVVCWIWKG
jgi:hypothetical protein